MYSTLNRIQNVFGFFTTVAFFVAALISLTSVIAPQAPTGQLTLRNVQVVKGRPHYYSTKVEEYAHVKFDLDVDLSSLYNWNTKQVFFFIVAKYPSHRKNDKPTEAVVWDAIVPAAAAPWHHNQYVHPSTSKTPKYSSKAIKPYRSSANGTNPGYLKLSNQRPKYVISDPSGKIAERQDAELELRWNVQPWVGALVWNNNKNWGRWKALEGQQRTSFEFPELSTKAKKDDLKTQKGGEGNRGKPA